MSTTIRRLSRETGAAALADLRDRAADSIALESGAAPDADWVAAVFDSAPPGARPEDCVKLGLFGKDPQLLGVGDMGFGYPEARDADIGLLLLAPDARGRGLGPMPF